MVVWVFSFLCGSAINSQLGQGVTLTSPFGSWDGFQQTPVTPTGVLKMDGWMDETVSSFFQGSQSDRHCQTGFLEKCSTFANKKKIGNQAKI